jgi:hypothetical protein
MQQLNLQAVGLQLKRADAKPSFLLGTTRFVPGNQALQAGGFLRGIPEEGTPQRVNGCDHPRRQGHGAHGEYRRTIRPPDDSSRAAWSFDQDWGSLK